MLFILLYLNLGGDILSNTIGECKNTNATHSGVSCLKERHLREKLQAELALFFFFNGTLFVLERTTDRQTVVLQTMASGRHSLENEQSMSVISEKDLAVFVVNDTI